MLNIKPEQHKGLRLDDEAVVNAISFMDEQSDLYYANTGRNPPVQNPSLDKIIKISKERIVDLTALRKIEPQTQDVLRMLTNNEQTLNLMASKIEKSNIFEQGNRQTILNLAGNYGLTMQRISMTDVPSKDLKIEDITMSLDNQQARVKELISFLNFKDPELRKSVEDAMQLDFEKSMRDRIMNVDISREMQSEISMGSGNGRLRR